MTDTRFAFGRDTAYVTDQVIALSGRADIDVETMALCVSGDWNAMTTAVTDGRLTAVVAHHGDRLQIAVNDAAVIDVRTYDGDRRFAATEGCMIDSVERPHHVTLLSTGEGRAADAEYRVDGGVVPASIVSRRLGASQVPPPDPFESMFGHTIPRSVEEAAVRDLDEAAPARSVLGVLVFSTGERVVIDADILLGRHPRRLDDSRDDRTRVVQLSHPAVSRRHAVIRLHRWSATIEDLGSANGTTLAITGRGSRAVRPGTPIDLAVGAIVDLGGHVSFSVEEAA